MVRDEIIFKAEAASLIETIEDAVCQARIARNISSKQSAVERADAALGKLRHKRYDKDTIHRVALLVGSIR